MFVCVCFFVSLVEVFETNPANGWFLHVSKDMLDPIQKKDGKTDQSLPSLKASIAPDDRWLGENPLNLLGLGLS